MKLDRMISFLSLSLSLRLFISDTDFFCQSLSLFLGRLILHSLYSHFCPHIENMGKGF